METYTATYTAENTVKVTSNSTTDSTAYTICVICPRCGGAHRLEQCHQVRAIEYYQNGKIKRAEFLTPGDYLPVVKTDSTWKSPYEIT